LPPEEKLQRPQRKGGRTNPSVKNLMEVPQETARAQAVKHLIRIEFDDAFANRLTQDIPSLDTQNPGGLSPRDQRFLKELVSGVTRWRRRLDWMLDVFTKNRVKQIEPVLLQILRIGMYELIELGMPAYAVTNHTQLAKELCYQGAGAFVNGTLRNVGRQVQQGTLPNPSVPPEGAPLEARADALGIACSHPTWMVTRWLQRYGFEETLDLLAANNRRPAHAVRLVSEQLQNDIPGMLAHLESIGCTARRSELLPGEFLVVDSRSKFQALLQTYVTSRTGGECQVQDEAAGLVVSLVDPQPGEYILDACAAPGGKTLFMAARMKNEGLILALDVSDKKLGALKRSAYQQNHAQIVRTQVGDLSTWTSPDGELYDKVLLDAPCSGLGVLAKRSDMRWKRTESEMEEYTLKQDVLLDAAARLVRPGGLLVYSTCSIEPEENQDRVYAFLLRKQNSMFAIEAPPEGLMPPQVLEGSFLATLPHRHSTDGAFAVRLRRAHDKIKA